MENPIINENLSPNAILLSITLKKFLWPPLTQWHGWLRERSSIKKKVYCGTPYSLGSVVVGQIHDHTKAYTRTSVKMVCLQRRRGKLFCSLREQLN